MRYIELIEDDAGKERTPNIRSIGKIPELERKVSFLVEQIYSKSKQWIQRADLLKDPIFRGSKQSPEKILFKNGSSYIGVGIVRKDRKPKDSSIETHNLYNEILAEMGIKANRSNSLFVSGDHYFSSEYGTCYVVIPIGPYNFSWNTEYKDLYLAFKDNISEFYDYHTVSEEYQKEIRELLKEALIFTIKNNFEREIEVNVRHEYRKLNTPEEVYNEYLNLVELFKEKGLPTTNLNIGGVNEDKKMSLIYIKEDFSYVCSRLARERTKLYLASDENKTELEKRLENMDAKVDDQIKNESDLFNNCFFNMIRRKPDSEKIQFINKEKVKDTLMKYYSNKDLKQAIHSGNEIMLNCKSFFMIDRDFWENYMVSAIRDRGSNNSFET